MGFKRLSAALVALAVGAAPAGADSSCIGDTDDSGQVDVFDLLAVVSAWGPAACDEGCPGVDVDQDGSVDVVDLMAVIDGWGECPLSDGAGWIAVLVAQYAPPSDHQTYVAKIKKLAPNLEQIHLRIPPTATPESHPDAQEFVALIGLLRGAYGASLEIGFHPDNSRTSCNQWGTPLCSTSECSGTPPEAVWTCVLDASIRTMNAMNALCAAQSPPIDGFGIFSIEQSYVEDVGSSLAGIKHCLGGDAGALPGVTPASPEVKFGNVLSNYGGQDVYGPDGYDYGYPQMYNKGESLLQSQEVMDLVTSGYFPSLSTPCVQASPTTQFKVVDNNVCGPYMPNIPCFEPCPSTPQRNIYNTDPATGQPGASPDLVASYLAYIMTQRTPITGSIPLNGSKVYITLSGEATEEFSFLGTDGWTLEKIAGLGAALDSKFEYLQQHAPSLFPSGGADPTTLQYAIWQFQPILDNITLP